MSHFTFVQKYKNQCLISHLYKNTKIKLYFTELCHSRIFLRIFQRGFPPASTSTWQCQVSQLSLMCSYNGSHGPGVLHIMKIQNVPFHICTKIQKSMSHFTFVQKYKNQTIFHRTMSFKDFPANFPTKFPSCININLAMSSLSTKPDVLL